MPKVSVIIPTYQNARFLQHSISSVLNQIYKDYEVLVVDDGSTDGSSEILNHFDSQIQVITQKNQGPAVARNTGIRASSGSYLAFLDSDDIALPDRLKQQVGFLDEHPDIGLLGSSAEFFDLTNKFLGKMQVPLEDLDIRWTCLLLNPFIQSTMMIRRELIFQNNLTYTPDFRGLEDYELWSRALAFTKSANLKKPLVRYRVRNDSMTIDVHQKKLEIHSRIACSAIENMLGECILNSKQIRSLCTFLMANPRAYARLGSQKATLVENYLDIWNAFAAQNHGLHNFSSLQRKVVLKSARLLFYPYPPKGWARIVSRLFTIEKVWPLWFIYTVPGSLIKILHESSISSSR